MESPAPAPGWYPDPAGRYDHRYFDGAVWTADVSRGGQRYVDVADWQRQPRPGGPGGGDVRYGAATAALVVGIIAVMTAWMPVFFVVGAILAVVALALGANVRRRRPADSRGFATAGMWLGGVALALCVVGFMFTRWVFGLIDEFEHPPPNEVTLTACTAGDGGVAIAGTIDHAGDEPSDFRIEIDVADVDRPSDDDRVVVELRDVDPDGPQPFDDWTASHLSRTADELTCDVHRVTGPAPFGVVPS